MVTGQASMMVRLLIVWLEVFPLFICFSISYIISKFPPIWVVEVCASTQFADISCHGVLDSDFSFGVLW